jgi:hypothetical protein
VEFVESFHARRDVHHETELLGEGVEQVIEKREADEWENGVIFDA